ncbi:MAG TPA: choice-of-anchor A family protein [Aliidongia sp.]|uniref:choice-of-anchor A family protein n=1 Tax=Aliidongia sp. TaxID=1914230 RepID=UPI002DDD17FF|nr:choice-of-anchor A family protein [Aliidongia sp.]HEV2676350.1 choice-of-anchor A family protein [Aliidongia sp.]
MNVRNFRAAATRALVAGTACAVLAMASAPARADAISVGTLDQLNLIVFGSVSSSSEIGGRAVIGGSLAGTSNVFINGTNATASSYAALTVGGSLAGTVNVNDGGTVIVGGSAGTINLNGGGLALVGGAITGNNNGHELANQGGLIIPSFKASALSVSSGLDQLTANSTLVQANQNSNVFTAHPDASGVAVFDITGAQLAAADPTFLLNGATSVIINVDAASLTLARNFNDASLGPNLLWNFYDATSLTFGTEFGGTILAPLAAVTNNNAIDGTLVANSLTQNGEIHLAAYKGVLPGSGTASPAGAPVTVAEPSVLCLLAVGLAGFLFARSRRRRT